MREGEKEGVVIRQNREREKCKRMETVSKEKHMRNKESMRKRQNSCEKESTRENACEMEAAQRDRHRVCETEAESITGKGKGHGNHVRGKACKSRREHEWEGEST